MKNIQIQPGERSKMKNFLYRGSKEQIAQAAEAKDETIMEPYDDEGSITYSKMKGTIESEVLTVNHPENSRRTVGWEWDEPNTLEENNSKIQQALLGRDLQTLQEVKKLVQRLKQKGFDLNSIKKFVLDYLSTLDEVVGFAMKTKPSVSGGLTQKNIKK